jgi:hypothetical protein
LASRRKPHRDHGLIHGSNHLQANRRRSTRQFGQGRHTHPPFGHRRIAKGHIRRYAGRGKLCPGVGLDIECKVDRAAEDHHATALAQRNGCGTANNHPATDSYNGVTYFHNNFTFG